MNWFRKKNRESGDRDIRKPDIRSFGDQGQKPSVPDPLIPGYPLSGSPNPRISFSYVIPVLLALFTGFLMIHTADVLSAPKNLGEPSTAGQTIWNLTDEDANATKILPIDPATYSTYTLKTGGIVAGGTIQLQSDSYTALQTSDAGTQDSCTSGGCVMPAGFAAGTSTATSTAVYDTGNAASVKLGIGTAGGLDIFLTKILDNRDNFIRKVWYC